MNEFSLTVANQFVHSHEPFPVDFGDLWEWVGYSKKDKAKDMLVKNFEEGIDYEKPGVEFSLIRGKTPSVGRPTEIIRLSVNAAKEFAMLAQTDKGKLVRRYFIQAEEMFRKELLILANKVQKLESLVCEHHRQIHEWQSKPTQQFLSSGQSRKRRSLREIANLMGLHPTKSLVMGLYRYCKSIGIRMGEDRLYEDNNHVRDAIRDYLTGR